MIKRKTMAVIAGAIVTGTLITMTAIISNESKASFVSADSTTNNFTDGTVDVEVVEKGNDDEPYKDPDSWTGNQYTKKVSIENKGNVPSLIRVELTPRWIDENDNAWAGDIRFIKFEPKDKSENWVKDESSGYYYYKSIVPEGGYTDELISSVYSEIPDELIPRYQGKKLMIDIKAEEVIAEKEAYNAAWTNISQDVKDVLDGLCRK